MTAPTTPPPSALEQLRRVNGMLDHIELHTPPADPPPGWPGTFAIRDAVAPAIQLLELLEQRPEIRPAAWVRGQVCTLEYQLADTTAKLTNELASVRGGKRQIELEFLLERLAWCAKRLRDLSHESWHEPPSARVPVGVATFRIDDTEPRVVALCSDGSYWVDDEAGRWEALSPIPDSTEDRRQRDAAAAGGGR